MPVLAVIERMNASVPDCMVTNYEKLDSNIELLDPNDRHVVARSLKRSVFNSYLRMLVMR